MYCALIFFSKKSSSSSGQDIALSRREHGFEFRWRYCVLYVYWFYFIELRKKSTEKYRQEVSVSKTIKIAEMFEFVEATFSICGLRRISDLFYQILDISQHIFFLYNLAPLQ